MTGKMKTPQTDDLARGNHVVPTEWAEQLERERDEARERSKMMDIKIAQQEAITELVLENQRLKRERDEAMQKYDNLATEHMLAINKLCNERDEAREIAQQLINIASHCLGWHENANPETITEAIKRWNASTKK
jgi:hypothetical protein